MKKPSSKVRNDCCEVGVALEPILVEELTGLCVEVLSRADEQASFAQAVCDSPSGKPPLSRSGVAVEELCVLHRGDLSLVDSGGSQQGSEELLLARAYDGFERAELEYYELLAQLEASSKDRRPNESDELRAGVQAAYETMVLWLERVESISAVLDKA